MEARSPGPAKNLPVQAQSPPQLPPVKNQPIPGRNPPSQLPPVKNQPLPAKNQPPPAKNQPLPGTKRETSLDPDDLFYLVDLLKRASVDADGDVSIALPPLRRWTTPADTRSYQISDVIFDEIPQGQGEVSSDTGDDLPRSQRGLVARGFTAIKNIIKSYFPFK